MKLTTYLVIAIQFIVGMAHAQVNSLSPYTRYALGDLQLSSSTQLQSMGHAFATYAEPFVINSDNPASYALAQKPVFDVGFKNAFLSYSNNNVTQTARGASLTGFRFLFPLKANKIGLSFGITPFSQSGYFISNTVNDPNIGDITYEYEGSGGINKVYLGVGAKVLGNDTLNVFVGANGMYLFGASSKIRRAILPTGNNNFNVSSINTLNISDVSAEGSVMVNWQPAKHKKTKYSFGTMVALGGDINGKQSELNRTYKETTFGTQSFKDTLSFVDQGKGSVNLPVRITTGASVMVNNKLFVGVNYSVADWSVYTETFNDKAVKYNELKSSSAISIGAEYTPQKVRLLSNQFWKSVNYRVGLRTEKNQLSINNDQLTVQAVSAGLGLPLLRSKSLTTFNIGAEVGTRKGNSANLVNENFVNIYLGMTFVPNKIDRWFVKRKYD